MDKKNASSLVDSRHLKILAAKKAQLADAIVLVCLDEEKYGNLDKAGLRKIIEQIDQIEPAGIYFPVTKKMDIQFYDLAQFKNKDVVITIGHDSDDVDIDSFEADIRTALSSAKSCKFVHQRARIEKL